MKRTVLFIAKQEILEQFRKNTRQDVKVVTPAIMTEVLAAKLRARGKDVKEEVPLDDCHWTHSPAEEPNKICESADFADESIGTTGVGPVAVSFADLGSVETFHCHKEHWEVYFSEHRLGVEYKLHEKPQIQKEVMNEGGAIVFAPGIANRMEIHGLTIVLELPAVPRDREASGLGDTQ
jgi:hypothetical protein